MESFLVKPELFCEIDWFDAKKFIDPNYELPWIKISMLYTLGMRLGIQKNRKILFLMIPSVCLKN